MYSCHYNIRHRETEIRMGASACLAMPKDLGAINVSDLLALPTLPSDRSAKHLSVSAEELIRNIASVADELVVCAIEKRTAADFIAKRNEVFHQYFDAVRSFSDLARIIVPKHVLEILAAESLSQMEGEFREHGLDTFGAAVRDQAIFTIWTMRKINDVCRKINSSKLSPELADADIEPRTHYAFTAVAARFHLDCLVKSMHFRQPIYPDVLNVVIDGLRNAVNAYVWAVRGLNLRSPKSESQIASVEWDDEDQALLNEATHDMVAEI
jgi:hypothetical protein